MGKGSRLARKMRRDKAFEILYSKKGKRSLVHILTSKAHPERSKFLAAIYWKYTKAEVL